MIQYVLKKNINEKMPNAYGKFFAYPVITQTYDIDQLVDHMASHNTPFSRGAIKGMITDMAFCIKELCLQGISVKIDDLAIFSIGIKNKMGAKSEKEFSIAKNIEGYKLRSRGTGELAAGNLDVEVKKVSSLLASEMQVPGVDSEDTTPGGTGDGTGGTGQDKNPSGSGTDKNPSGSEGGGDSSDSGDNVNM